MAFLLLWMPYSVAGVSLALGTFSLPKEVMLASLMLAIASYSVNPVIYGVMNKKFSRCFYENHIGKKNVKTAFVINIIQDITRPYSSE